MIIWLTEVKNVDCIKGTKLNNFPKAVIIDISKLGELYSNLIPYNYENFRSAEN